MYGCFVCAPPTGSACGGWKSARVLETGDACCCGLPYRHRESNSGTPKEQLKRWLLATEPSSICLPHLTDLKLCRCEYPDHFYFLWFLAEDHAFFQMFLRYNHFLSFSFLIPPIINPCSFWLRFFEHSQCNFVYILLLQQLFFPLNLVVQLLSIEKDNLVLMKQPLLFESLLHQ